MVVDALQKLQAQRQPQGFRRHRLPASVSAIRCRAVASVCASVLLNRPAMRTGSTKR